MVLLAVGGAQSHGEHAARDGLGDVQERRLGTRKLVVAQWRDIDHPLVKLVPHLCSTSTRSAFPPHTDRLTQRTSSGSAPRNAVKASMPSSKLSSASVPCSSSRAMRFQVSTARSLPIASLASDAQCRTLSQYSGSTAASTSFSLPSTSSASSPSWRITSIGRMRPWVVRARLATWDRTSASERARET